MVGWGPARREQLEEGLGEAVGSQEAQEAVWMRRASSGGLGCRAELRPSWGPCGAGEGLRAGRMDGHRRFCSLNGCSEVEERGLLKSYFLVRNKTDLSCLDD